MQNMLIYKIVYSLEWRIQIKATPINGVTNLPFIARIEFHFQFTISSSAALFFWAKWNVLFAQRYKINELVKGNAYAN